MKSPNFCFDLNDLIFTVFFIVYYVEDGQVVRASASEAVDLGVIPSRVKTNNFQVAIHRFPAGRSALKGQCGDQAGKFTCCAVGKGT